jgi:hypothetical protein
LRWSDGLRFCARHLYLVATLVAAEEHPVIASNRYAADVPLSGIVIDAQIAIFAVAVQRHPVLQAAVVRKSLHRLRTGHAHASGGG